jgi:hypothetical protein
MVMIRSLQRDENDRGLVVGDKPGMTPFWKPEIIHYGEHHYHHCHHDHNAVMRAAPMKCSLECSPALRPLFLLNPCTNFLEIVPGGSMPPDTVK